MPPWSPNYWTTEAAPVTEDVKAITNIGVWAEMATQTSLPLPCSVVKGVMLANGEIYFMNTNNTAQHYAYLKSKFGESRSLEVFNDVVYSGKNRDIICPTIIKYGGYTDDHEAYPWTFEMVSTDPLVSETCTRVALAFEKFQAAFGCGKLAIRATSHAQYENLLKPDHPLHKYPRIDPIVVWQGKTYGSLVCAEATGTLRIVQDANNAAEIENLTANDAVFFKSGIPNDLPVVAAAIFAEHLPPLCHISILCRNRRTPCCFDASPNTAQLLADLVGRSVHVTVGHQALTVKQANASLHLMPHPMGWRIAEPDRNMQMPIRFASKSERILHANQIGAKARQCCMVNMTAEQMEFNSKSFAIPMGAYIKHMSSVKIRSAATEVKRLFDRSQFKVLPSIKDVKPNLEQLREVIMKSQVDSELLQTTLSMINECGAEEVILRSSTNAEDIRDFTGAGLYQSVRLKVAGLNVAQLSTAIKTVWASVWLPKAFLERLNFGIDHDRVAMCILVQPFYGSEAIAANGVAITANPLNATKYGVFVTAFGGGDHRATDSVTGVQAEQSVVHMSRVPGKFEVELVAPARGPGINSTKPVCDPKILEELGRKCAKLHSQLLGEDISKVVDDRYSRSKQAIDVEWVLLKEGNRLLIIQARQCPAN